MGRRKVLAATAAAGASLTVLVLLITGAGSTV